MTPEEARAAAEKAARRDEIRSSVLDIVGALLIVAGVGLWSIPVAVVIAGVAVLLIAHPIPVRRWRK